MSTLEVADVGDIEFVEGCWDILIADDSSTCRKFLRKAVESFSFPARIHEVADAAEALAQLASNRYDIAFLDVGLGDACGLDALARARAGGSGTFVVMVSGHLDGAGQTRAQALGAYDYILKPFPPARIHGVLDSFSAIRTRRTALIVDDSGTARKLMSRVFERSIFDIAVSEAADGVEGFEDYVRRPTDVVFLDLHMGVLDGLSTARIFRAHKRDVKIVLVTTSADHIDPVAFPFVLRKPFSAEELDALLHRLFGLALPFGTLDAPPLVPEQRIATARAPAV
jgi:two-component system, chemotaxis family, chemotaxis protein CheY